MYPVHRLKFGVRSEIVPPAISNSCALLSCLSLLHLSSLEKVGLHELTHHDTQIDLDFHVIKAKTILYNGYGQNNKISLVNN